jgi:phosphatidate cytidylyltransferase
MKERIISGTIIAAAIIVLGLVGGYPLANVLLICSLIGYYELMKACGVLKLVRKRQEQFNMISVIGFASTAALYFMLQVCAGMYTGSELLQKSDFWTLCIVTAFFMISMAGYVFAFPKYEGNQIMISVFGFLYCPVMLSFVYRARTMGRFGIFVYALIFICSSVCDTCAYAVGMMLGRHKMAPVLSPKKTVEGAVGGVAGSVLVCFLLPLLMEYLYPDIHLQLEFTVLGVCGALISMIGDLAASAIKRNHNIKDYGKLIPGHGGIMDRFDSIIFTAPMIYFLAVLLIGEI